MGMADTYSVPAYPHKVTVYVDGKQIFIRLFGDEYCHWAETQDGFSLVQDTLNRWCYATTDSDGRLVPTKYHLKASLDNGTLMFLSNQPRHLRPNAAKSLRVKKARKALAASKTTRKPVVGQRRMLVILMAYKDRPFTKTVDDFYKLFNEKEYQDDGARGSVHDFYDDVSYGQLQVTCDIYGPYTAQRNMSYYGRDEGDNTSPNAYKLFQEAINHVADETDLTQYDGDGDGYIDNVHIVFAGYGQEFGAEADAIWSHESSFQFPYFIKDIKIDRYSCAPELRNNRGKGISRIGVHCHEIGHALGAMDYYDTEEDAVEYIGTGEWDVMASGSHNSDGISPADFNPYVKAFDFGWVKPKALPLGKITVLPSNDSSEHYYILQSQGQGDYYLLENRQRTGWGRGLPGAGLLIYHIHQDIETAENYINATHPQMCYVVCASLRYDKPDGSPESYGGENRINSTGCPYPGFSHNTSFTPSSTPAAFWWTGEPCRISLTEITQHDDYSITLLNESEDVNIEPEETELITLLNEGFEGEPLIQTDSQLWQVEQSGNGITAYKGKQFLMLSAKNEFLQSIEDACEFTYNKMYDGSITVKGHFLSNSLRGRSNMIRIGYRIQEKEDVWIYHDEVSSVDGKWNSFEVKLPDDALPTIRIEGTAVPLSVLAMDEIVVEQVVSNAVIVVKTNRNIPHYRQGAFALSGQRVFIPERLSKASAIHLPAGMYIIEGKKIVLK